MQQENRNLERNEQDRIGTGQQQDSQKPATTPAEQQENANQQNVGHDETGETDTQRGDREKGPDKTDQFSSR